MKRVLVTGATGFIGRHVVPELLERGYEVHAVVRTKVADDPPSQTTFHVCDLFDTSRTRALMTEVRPSHLVHLAWYAEPGLFWNSLQNLQWVAASLELYLDFASQGGCRALFAGTCAEYDWTEPLLEEQSTPLRPRSLYGEAKNALRVLLERASRLTAVTTAWGRIFYLYGPYEPTTRLVPEVITALLAGRPAHCSEGTQQRDFMHVQDVARAFVHVLESDHCGPINIASGRSVPVRDVVSLIADVLGRRDLIQIGRRATPQDEPPVLAAAVDRLCGTGFRPRYDLESGLAQTIDWWRRQVSSCGSLEL